MTSPFKDIKEFNDLLQSRGCVVKPFHKYDLIEEEYGELDYEVGEIYTEVFWLPDSYDASIRALQPEKAEAILKEIVDNIYVMIGFAQYFGWDIEGAFKEVHNNNMDKINTGTFKNGKLHKDPDHPEPDLSPYINPLHGTEEPYDEEWTEY